MFLIVALGLAAVGGYMAKGFTSGGVTASQSEVAPAVAPGTELPGYVLAEMAPKATPRILRDDPNFIAQYTPSWSADELPGYVPQETAAKATPRLRRDDPDFIAHYSRY